MLLRHVASILALPVVVVIVIPMLIYNGSGVINNVNTGIALKWVGVLLLLGGLILMTTTILYFARMGRGTLAPWDPPKNLVIAGPYKHWRNPMISGVIMLLIGEGLVFNSGPILLWAGIFFVTSTIYFIYKEEPDLEKRFGDDYRKYKNNVPRWLPRIKRYDP